MNFDFSDDQKFLQQTARDYLAEHSPLSACREILETDKPYADELWKGAAEMGWQGAVIPEETVLTRLHDDVTATLRQHRFPTSTRPIMEVCGTEGRLLWTEVGLAPGGAWWLPHPQYKPDGTHDQWQALEPTIPDGFDPQSPALIDEYCFVEEYVNALDENREPESSGVEEHHVVEIMMGAFESAAYGRRVELPQADRQHPLRRWRREHGLGEPPPVPRDWREWLIAEDRRLGRQV